MPSRCSPVWGTGSAPGSWLRASADAGGGEAAGGEILLDAVGADQMAGADGDEHRSRLVHAVSDPARPGRVAVGEQGLVGQRALGADIAEDRREAVIVAALPCRLHAADH